MRKLLSDTVYFDISVSDVEAELTKRYGSIVRWSVVEVEEDKIKVCFTYEKDPH